MRRYNCIKISFFYTTRYFSNITNMFKSLLAPIDLHILYGHKTRYYLQYNDHDDYS